MKQFLDSHREWIFCSVLILIGAALRIYQIDRLPLWFDEAVSYSRALMSISEIIKASYSWDYNPATYYIIQHFVIKLGHSEAIVRSFSLLAGVAALPVFYRMAKDCLERREALIAMALFAFSAYQVRYAQEARVFMVFFLSSLIAAIYFHRILMHGRRKDWILWSLFQLTGLYLHYFAPIFIAAHVLTWGIDRLLYSSDRKRFYDIKWLGLALLILFVGFMPQLYYFIIQAAGKMDSGNALWIVHNPVVFVLIFVKKTISPVDMANPFFDGMIKYAILLMMTIGLAAAWKKYQRIIVIHLSVTGIALFFSWISTFVLYFSGTFRYVIFLITPFMVLLAIALYGWSKLLVAIFRPMKSGQAAIDGQRIPILYTIIPVIFIIAIQGYALQQLYTQPITANWPEAAQALQSRTDKESLVLTAPEWVDYMLKYYLARDPSSPKVVRIKDMTIRDLDSLVQIGQPFWILKTDHMPSKAQSREFDDWLAEHGERIWQDRNFPQYGIWEVQ